MKFWLAALFATWVLPAFARDAEERPPHVPAEVMSIQGQIPSVPDSAPVSSYTAPANLSASPAVLGNIGGTVSGIVGSSIASGVVGGTTVSGIGSAALPPVPVPSASQINSIIAPRIR
jgi:hypothetical protein